MFRRNISSVEENTKSGFKRTVGTQGVMLAEILSDVPKKRRIYGM